MKGYCGRHDFVKTSSDRAACSSKLQSSIVEPDNAFLKRISPAGLMVPGICVANVGQNIQMVSSYKNLYKKGFYHDEVITCPS